ncbi:MAG TPA: sugar ABC transporter permease [Anaerolineae bacterium]|nr:sugar ABC transporter permease [Anaerolineae bacterium]
MAETTLSTKSLPREQKSNTAQLRPRFSWFNDRALIILFLTPTMLLLLGITIFPLIWSLGLSFTQYSIIKSATTTPTFVGLDNYANLLADKALWERFWITARFVVPAVAIEFLLGFGLALLLNRNFKGRGLVMTLMLIPMMLSPVVVALFWRFMYQADIGILNYFVRDLLHLPPVFWLTNLNVAMWSIILVDVWQWTPFIMLIALAGLSAVPKYLYEAADVDRASAWFKFRHITLPLVTPLLLIALLFRLIDTYRLFDTAYVLTGGSPGHSTELLSLWLYQVAFRQFNTGEGSAMGYIMLVVIIALANMLLRVLNQAKQQTQ